MSDNKGMCMTVKQRKAENNRLKRVAKKQQEMGDAFVPESQGYIMKTERERPAHEKKTASYLRNAANVHTPPEYSLESLPTTFPDVYEYIMNTPHIRVTKNMHPDLVKAIWFLELDDKHNFNTRNKVPGANFAWGLLIAGQKFTQRDIRPKLIVPYVIACYERRWFPDRFVDRYRFIKLWLESQEDIFMFSKEKVKKINKMVRDLKRSLESSVEQPESEKFDSMAAALDDVINEEFKADELNETGEKLFANTAMKEEHMGWGDTQFEMYGGEESIEKGLSSKSDVERDAALVKWIDQTLVVMQEKLDQLKAQEFPDMYTMTQYAAKMWSLTELRALRFIAADLGFEEFNVSQWEHVAEIQ